MSAESRESAQRQPPPTALGICLRLAAGALALLLVSEALWLWETWPVRELLQPPVQAPAPAPAQ